MCVCVGVKVLIFPGLSERLVEGSKRSMQLVGLHIDCVHFADIPYWWQ